MGVLTGGGDCPGLNAVIRAIVRKAERVHGDTVIGFEDGWTGVMENRWLPLDIEAMRGTLPRGGTVLGTSRANPYIIDGGVDACRDTFADKTLDALIAIGGEGTLGVTRDIHGDGLPVVGVPKTIDNDIVGTEFTFGFHTAVQIATDAIDRLHTTAESHDRVMLVEVMGRHAGWIAAYAGIAGGAAAILVPEHPFDLDALCQSLVRRHQKGRYASIVVVAEGAIPKDGTFVLPDYGEDHWGHVRLGGISSLLGPEVEKRTGYETRVTILGHTQRGGTPTAFDRVLATRFGIAAIDAVHDRAFGHMVALKADAISPIPLADATGRLKTLDPKLYREVAEVFFA